MPTSASSEPNRELDGSVLTRGERARHLRTREHIYSVIRCLQLGNDCSCILQSLKLVFSASARYEALLYSRTKRAESLSCSRLPETDEISS